MKALTSIVALNTKGAIGCRNQLPWRLKTDMQFFRSQTLNNLVIMGRKTFESIGGELPHRDNIVLSHNSVLFQKTANSEVATSINEALVKAALKKTKKTFIIGGASTYSQFSHYVDRYLITIVDKAVSDADAYFDETILGNENDWKWEKINSIQWSPEHDDAPFEVFEVIHKRPSEIYERRKSLINEYIERMPRQAKIRRNSANSIDRLSERNLHFQI